MSAIDANKLSALRLGKSSWCSFCKKHWAPSRSGHWGEEKSPLPLPGMEPRPCLLPYRLNCLGSHRCFTRCFAASGLFLVGSLESSVTGRGVQHGGGGLVKFNLRSVSQMCARTSGSKWWHVISPLTALQRRTGNHSRRVLLLCAEACLDEGTDRCAQGTGRGFALKGVA
jgi:hypothetical protein